MWNGISPEVVQIIHYSTVDHLDSINLVVVLEFGLRDDVFRVDVEAMPRHELKYYSG